MTEIAKSTLTRNITDCTNGLILFHFLHWKQRRMSLLPPFCMDNWTWIAKNVRGANKVEESMAGSGGGLKWRARGEQKRGVS